MAPFFEPPHWAEPEVDYLDLLATLSQALLALITVGFLVFTWTIPETGKSLFSHEALWIMATPSALWMGWFIYRLIQSEPASTPKQAIEL